MILLIFLSRHGNIFMLKIIKTTEVLSGVSIIDEEKQQKGKIPYEKSPEIDEEKQQKGKIPYEKSPEGSGQTVSQGTPNLQGYLSISERGCTRG
jgi:hypothetical protein